MPSSHVSLFPGTSPSLPEALAPLVTLAYNFHWTFSPLCQRLWTRIDPALWESTGHNPVRLLVEVPSERLAELARDASFVADVRAAASELAAHLSDTGWFAGKAGALDNRNGNFLAAYFCAEFGISECFQIYSGGLGLLAGDHLKSAAELGLPLVAVGLLYRNGYFHQKLDSAGTQQEVYPPLDPVRQPVKRVMLNETGRQLTVSVRLPGRDVHCAVWRADVGKVRLYLLDTNIADNAAEDREITANLYLGDQNRRIQQEIVLGIGGVRALEALGEKPTVYHMNEGHAAFLALERIRQIRAATGVSFDQAREAASPAHLFTTHTPVPAGIDHFNIGLVQHYFADMHADLGLDMEGFMALGREKVENKNEPFSMAILAIRCSKFCNGVSKLHGEVSRRMWRGIWPSTPTSDVPIGHVTNGIHTGSWLSPVMGQLLDKHLPDGWRTAPHDDRLWAKADSIPDKDLWAAREASRRTLIDWTRHMSARDLTGGVKSTLDPAALTIGFARRFAGYKRGTLLMRDLERLGKLLDHSAGTPVQFIISGKSHPGDGWGKNLIRDVVEFTRSPKARGRVLFIEDYAIDVAKELVRGCDIWLNTPIRGLEASGTSGMKAALNGVMHASILDGWWDEGFVPDAGYKIADSGIYPSDAPNESRENFEADALYRLIERELIPDFYTRDSAGVPARWTAKMRRSIRVMAPQFSTHRMVIDYAEKYYFPAHGASSKLSFSDLKEARELSDHLDRYRKLWSMVRVKSIECTPSEHSREQVVSAAVRLGTLRPDEVIVQAFAGAIDADGVIDSGSATPLEVRAPLAGGDGSYHFTGRCRPPAGAALAGGSGVGVLVRVLPGDDRLVNPFIPGLIATSQVVLVEALQTSGV
jgi:glycogen phosphorylase